MADCLNEILTICSITIEDKNGNVINTQTLKDGDSIYLHISLPSGFVFFKWDITDKDGNKWETNPIIQTDGRYLLNNIQDGMNINFEYK